MYRRVKEGKKDRRWGERNQGEGTTGKRRKRGETEGRKGE